MGDHSIFGETLRGQLAHTPSAGARIQNGTPCHGLFGARLFPDQDSGCKRPGNGPDELTKSLS
jgi:hypothetical protein